MTAADLLRLGFSIFPVRDKKPLVSWKEYQTRRATEDEVGVWERRFAGCQWGIATGPVSGLLVLDQDYKGALGRPMPATWRTATTRGYHYYLNWRPEYGAFVTTDADVAPGLDVRGAGGFVVFHKPEAGFGMGRPKEAPAWLVSLLGGNQESGRPRLVEVAENIREGNRNNSFASLAGSLRARGLGPDEIFALLCDKAKAVGLPDEELRAVCESVGRYTPRSAESEAASVADFLKDEEKVEWLIQNLIPCGGIGFIAGLPESGKTWGLMDLAIAASGPSQTPWLGRYSVTPRRGVLFLDQERHKSETQRRFAALLRGRGLSPSGLNLMVRCGSTTRLDLDPSYEAFKRLLDQTKPGLVIIDSWVTLLSHSNENDRNAVQLVMERVKEMRQQFGCTFIFVDHENKTAYQDSAEGVAPSAFRMVGSVAKVAAAEFVFTVRKQDAECSTWYHTKSTMSAAAEPFTVAVRDVDETKTKIVVEAI